MKRDSFEDAIGPSDASPLGEDLMRALSQLGVARTAPEAEPDPAPLPPNARPDPFLANIEDPPRPARRFGGGLTMIAIGYVAFVSLIGGGTYYIYQSATAARDDAALRIASADRREIAMIEPPPLRAEHPSQPSTVDAARSIPVVPPPIHGDPPSFDRSASVPAALAPAAEQLPPVVPKPQGEDLAVQGPISEPQPMALASAPQPPAIEQPAPSEPHALAVPSIVSPDSAAPDAPAEVVALQGVDAQPQSAAPTADAGPDPLPAPSVVSPDPAASDAPSEVVALQRMDSQPQSPAPADAGPADTTTAATEVLPSAGPASQDFRAQGEVLLARGDIVSARNFFEYAAGHGDVISARLVGQTYDPAFLRRVGARGVPADLGKAAYWYGRAAATGDAVAAESLKRLPVEHRS